MAWAQVGCIIANNFYIGFSLLDIWYSLSPPSLPNCLNEEELFRQERFVFAKHREFFARAHTLKRLVLSFYDPAIQPSEWQFDKGVHGKPAIKQPYPYRFNLSHSESSVAIAIAETEIGVDIELCKPVAHLESLAQTVFHPLEQHWLWKQSSIEQSFFRLWTIKEALLKAAGTGFSQAPKEFFCEGLEGESSVTASVAGVKWRCLSRQVGDYALSFAVPFDFRLENVRYLQVGAAPYSLPPLSSPSPAINELLRYVDVVT